MPLRAYRFSRPAPSATRTPIQNTRRLDAQTPRRRGHARHWKLMRGVLPDHAWRRELLRHASTPRPGSPVTYASYLRLDELLSLQQPGPEHDETLFIVIHQVYD